MRFNPVTFRSIAFVVAITAVLQSLAWIVLCTLGLLSHACILPVPSYERQGFVVSSIVKFYFEDVGCRVPDAPPELEGLKNVDMLKPSTVCACFLVLFAINGIHFIASSCLLRFLRGKEAVLKGLLTIWCSVTLITAIFDLLISGMFFSDYLRIQEEDRNGNLEKAASVPLALSIIAIRGIALWFFNLFAFLYFILWNFTSSEKVIRDEKKTSFVSAYDNRAVRSSSECTPPIPVPPPMPERMSPVYSRSPVAPRPARREVPPQRRSAEPAEGVTAFNTPHSGGSREGHCDCFRKEKLGLNGMIHQNQYHSHGCRQLTSELENKLLTIRIKQGEHSKVKSLEDFSHDIKNFKQGEGLRRNLRRVDSSPRSYDDSRFY